MSKYAMLIEYKYCTGCHACEVSCRNTHNIPLNEWGIKINEMGPVKMQDKWLWDYVPVPSDLCDLCEERVEQGKQPSCMLHCLANCMELVPVEEVSAALSKKGNKTVVYLP